MVCPYRVVVVLVTIALGCILSLDLMGKKEGTSCEEEKKKDWKDRGMMYKTAYVAGIVTLIVFHLELFSGGYLCKMIFAKPASEPQPLAV
eukprot:m.31348 g.31348  ORF g.31348 m.31348 type:complete len:90 (+) comp9303_c1_seq1:4079-4348(+)